MPSAAQAKLKPTQGMDDVRDAILICLFAVESWIYRRRLDRVLRALSPEDGA